MEIAELHVGDFGDTTARGIENGEEGAVAMRETVGLARGGEEAIDRFGAHDMGEVLPELGGVEEVGNAIEEDSFEDEIAEEEFEGDEIAGDTAGGELGGFLEVGDVVLQAGEVDLVGSRDFFDFQPSEEAVEVAGVGEDGVFGHPAFGFEVVDET